MLALSPADRAALWHETITSAPDDRAPMLRVLAKEIQELLAPDLDLYSDWDEALEATLRTLDASGLIGRDVLRHEFEGVGTEDEADGTSAAEFALTIAGALDESAAVDHMDLQTRELALELASMWRDAATSDAVSKTLPDTLSVADVAAHFGVTPQAVYKWCEAGKIEFARTPGGSYRIPSAQFDWHRGKETESARREIAARLLRHLDGKDLPSDEEMVAAMRQARGR